MMAKQIHMKIISLLLLTVFLSKGCNDEAQQQDLKAAVIEYTANTRGFFRKVTIKDGAVFIQNDRSEAAAPTKLNISDADQKELVAAFNEIDLEGIAGLKAPSEKRFHDGAAIANLKITYKEKVYESQAFDHGTPPAEIEKLVNKMVSFIKEE
jgi:hypothetical protein